MLSEYDIRRTTVLRGGRSQAFRKAYLTDGVANIRSLAMVWVCGYAAPQKTKLYSGRQIFQANRLQLDTQLTRIDGWQALSRRAGLLASCKYYGRSQAS